MSNIKLVPDTSVIIDGRISREIEGQNAEGIEVIISKALIAELEAQANKGKETGLKGLEELKKLSAMAKEGRIGVSYQGERPNMEQIKLASVGEIDSMIRDLAFQDNALFVTSDRVQSEVARAMGIDVEYIYPKKYEVGTMLIDKYFTSDTLSVHLKEGVVPMAKRGMIATQKLEKLGSIPTGMDELRKISRELLERAQKDSQSFMEIDYGGATVLQIANMRICIAQPPFSDDFEITAVRPIAKVDIESYQFSDELKERIQSTKRGVLVAGPPGAGKSTFAASVAEFLQKSDVIIKTMESPRDLQVGREITQYAPLDGSMRNTADILLLVRPDYTIYDEVRKSEDFHVFADLRLAGVGMVGVMHANHAIDAIQRLIGRIDIGLVQQVVDTVIFIECGEVSKVYDIEFTVAVPHGMTESDLARPVVTVKDFETQDVEYEIYTYGEQTIVMPVKDSEFTKPSWDLAKKQVEREMARYTDGPVKAEMTSDSRVVVRVDESDIPRILGRGGQTIAKIEKYLGIGIDVRTLEGIEDAEKAGQEKGPGSGRGKVYDPTVEESSRHLILSIAELAGDDVDVYGGSEYIFTATVGRHGDIKISKGSVVAESIYDALDEGYQIKVRKSD
ncbi:MAG: Flp pilus assembly complex ATPase component TadA [Methanosarcinales archaeon]|nr:Flp pilus assembly complex ATPase component TadA [Methanosarcinales archaeon]